MSKNKNWQNRILISLTGRYAKDWQYKIKEIEHLKLRKIALFLEMFKLKERQKIYQALLHSPVKNIPFVHIREDITKNEMKFLNDNFNSQYFNIHENFFDFLERWRGYYKKLYLEMNYDNNIKTSVKVDKIGGFCIDLAHYKAACDRNTIECDFVNKHQKYGKLFKCNHLSGYDQQKKIDLHWIKNLNNFNYLKSLPEFIFGDYIAIEVFNPIKDQLRYKKYIVKLLSEKK